MLEGLLRLLDGEPSDEIVWTAGITYWITGQQQAGTAKAEWDTEEGCLQLHKELGILPYYYYEKFYVAEPQYDGPIEVTEEREADKNIRRFRTPAGELTEEKVYSPVSCSLGITKHFVESEGDLDILLYLLEHRHLEPTNIEDYPQRMEVWKAYDGLPSIGLPRSPLTSLLVEWAGVVNGIYLIMDCPKKVAKVLRLMEEQEGPVIEAICELAPPLVHFPDNLSSDNVTSFYDDYMAGTHQRRLERLHAAGVKCAVHLDGTVRGLLPKLVRSGFDSIEALTPKPAGDLEIEDIQDLADSDTLILWGGVPGIMFAPPYTWDQMKAHVQRLIECWGDRPFIMGVADQVPPDGDIEFCRKISELICQ